MVMVLVSMIAMDILFVLVVVAILALLVVMIAVVVLPFVTKAGPIFTSTKMSRGVPFL
jgi:hypothetical protein